MRMKRLIVLLAGALVGACADGAVTLRTAVDRQQIYFGESITLTIRADSIDEGVQPDLSKVRDCTIVLTDSHAESFEPWGYINGRRTVNRFHGQVFTYRVTPTRAGALRLGPIVVEQDGRTATDPGPTVQVAAPEAQEVVAISVVASRPDSVIDEPFEIITRVRIRRLAPPYADQDPIAPRSPPMLTLPFINDDQPDGLQTLSVRELLAPRLVGSAREAGFGINEIGLDRGVSFFPSLFDESPFRRQLAVFQLDRAPVQEDGKDYFVYTLRVQYRAARPGVYRFGPVSFKGETIVGVTRHGQARTRPIYTYAPACAVTVSDLPTKGRPATFIGTLGTALTATAALDTQTCREGDPLTLTVTFGGNVNLERIRPPALSIQTNLLRHFRVYDDTVQGKTAETTRQYSFTIRPTTSGTLEVPPLAFSYFDIERRDYATVLTAPIPVRANQAVVANIESVVGTDETVTIAGDDSPANALVPAPFRLDGNLTTHQRLFVRQRHVPLLLLGPCVYALAALARFVGRRAPSVRARARRRRAPDRATRTLLAIDVADSELAARACHAICHAIGQYLVERWEVPAGGLTPPDAARHLAARNVPAGAAETLLDAWRRGTAGAFAPDSLTAEQLADLRDTAVRGIAAMEDKST
jgi:hypothetical protein